MEILYHDTITPSGQPADVVISALQKFIRRAQVEQAARAAYELYLTSEELTDYMWKRLLVISAEDVGLGEPTAPAVIAGLREMSREFPHDNPDYPVFFVHAVRYLCSCPKERGSSILGSVIKRRIRSGEAFALPDYVFDMHTIEGQQRGRDVEHFLAESAPVYPVAVREAEVAAQEAALEQELMMRIRKEQ